MGANDSATIKCTFKNIKTAKKVTKNVKVNVIANKAEEQVVEAFAIDVTATTKKTFEVKFNKAVSDEAVITLEKVDSGVATVVETESTKVADDKLSAVITLKANIQSGTYKVTVKDGEAEASKEIATTEDAATQIKITSTQALTDDARKEAYIYYDVIDQYGESIRNSSSIKWTVSAPALSDDLAEGKITIYANATGSTTNTFMYGSDVVVVGVDTTAQLTVQETVKIGMPQKLDSVNFKGFVDTKGDKTKLLDTLPANFAKGRYVLAYEAFDQDSHKITLSTTAQGKDVMFTSSNPMLVDMNALKYQNKTRTPEVKIGKDKYYTIAIEPGEYVAQGGEVVITAVSTNTGNKKSASYVIGGVPVLKSFKFGQPETLRAGDANVNVPFTATDVNGNVLNNYESIVRSSNELSFTCTRGTLKLSENDDGTAKLTWSDDTENKNLDWTSDDVMKNDGQVTMWNAVVMGTSGDIDNKTITLKPARMPVDISKVDVASTIVVTGKLAVGLNKDDASKNKIWFVDQDGNDISKEAAYNFFNDNASGTTSFKDDFKYWVTVTVDNSAFDYSGANLFGGHMSVDFTSNDVAATMSADKDSEITYQIMRKHGSDNEQKVGDGFEKSCKVITLASAKKKVISFVGWMQTKQVISLGDVDKYDNLKDAVLDNKITEIPAEDAAAIRYSTPISANSTSAIWFDRAGMTDWWESPYCWFGIVAGADIEVPATLFTYDEGNQIACGDEGAMSGFCAVTAGALTWGDFYDSTTGARKVAKKSFKLVAKDDSSIKISKTIEISNKARELATIEFAQDYWRFSVNGDKISALPFNGAIQFMTNKDDYVDSDKNNWGQSYVVYKDQYGQNMSKTGDSRDAKTTFTITDLKEADTELTHVPGNLDVDANGTANAKVIGAEVGDTFKLTVACGSVKTEYTVTVKADNSANLTAQAGTSMANNDKTFRMEVLKYKK